MGHVAVVVPVFNRKSAVLETLSTVARQTLPPRRLIVVDDGSTDGTADSVRRWIAATKPDFEAIVVEQRNQGAGAARNRGLRETGNCKYVAFLDSDDHWPTDFLARTVARLDDEPTAVAATTDRIYHRRWKRRLGRRSSRGLQGKTIAWLLCSNSGIASCTLFRTGIARRVGGYDPTLPTGQDVEFFLRVALEGRWLHAPGEPVHFYVGFTGQQGEAGNLSFKYADRQRRWIRIRERFISRQNGNVQLSTRYCKRELARRWHKTACVYWSQRQYALAAASLRKAIQYQPTKVFSWCRLAVLEVRRVVKSSPAFRVKAFSFPGAQPDATTSVANPAAAA